MQAERAEPTDFEAVLPASFAQQRMWFLEQFEGGALYNVPVATRLRGLLDVAALERSFDALVDRHESLRTRFSLVDDVPQQVIRPAGRFSLGLVDVSHLPDAAGRALEIASEQARERFDLAEDDPIRVVLVKIGKDDHLLSVVLHHIVADAWSMGVLSSELGELYAGFCAGRRPELPELQIQYADYAVWQREWIESGGLDRQLDFWRGELAGAPPLLELPTDHPRPPRQSFRGATARVTLPPELADQVRRFAEEQSATLFITLLSAFGALLSRYTGEDDVVVASPVANRNRVELEGVIGLFVNTLPLRVDLDGDPSFVDLLARVRNVALGAFSNQELPFEKLVETLAPERHLSYPPVAQVMFVVQNAVERPPTFPGLGAERILTDRGTAKFDLTFFAREARDGLHLSVEYCTDLFDESTAVRMLEHYRILLEGALAEPSRPVGSLRLLTDAEEQLELEVWNATATPHLAARERPVHELVAEQARRTPAAVAVVSATEELTYAELDSRAEQLAGRLADLGVERGSIVAICAERSVEMVVGVLAILKAGAAYAPIDPNYPDERVEFMLADTAAQVLLTQQKLAASLPPHGAAIVLLDADLDEPAGIARQAEAEATLDDLAYVIYTSGSTGRPKGVAMAHGALTNLIAWQLRSWEEAGVEPARTLQFASLSFDVAFQELFSTWCSGGALVLVDDELRSDAEALAAFLGEHRVERLFLPFVALHNLCETAGYRDLSLPALRQVITAGEQLKCTDAIRDFFERHPDCTLVNQYGPTESHVATAHTLEGPPVEWPALPPIGRPIANARIYLLDRNGQPVPVGVPGELCIGGVSLARGYLGRPDLTAERFLPDPFAGKAEARLYRTGDLARYRSDGEIDYLGRADHQVKIRGFRVEPGEIENVLREHPAVREALVLAKEDGTGGKRLVGYLLADGTGPSPDELHGHLARTLPEYMIPTAFAILDAFPLTPNGKIDRNALPVADGFARGSMEYVPPAAGTEASLAEIWARLLDVERVGAFDNFFALGGHSLLAIQLVSRVRDELEVEMPLRMVFEAPTVSSFALAIEDVRGRAAGAGVRTPIPPVARTWTQPPGGDAGEKVCVLPASFAEQRLWFLDRLDPDSGAYNLTLARRLHGRLDAAALERALSGLVARHESLRTTFSMVADAPMRVIRPGRPVPLPLLDLRDEDDQRVQAVVQAESKRGFDLESGPLLRATLLRVGDEEHVFVLSLHHIVVDGWSMDVLNRELSELYAAHAQGRPAQLPELPLQYADFAAWQQEWMTSGGLDDQLDYWKEQLSGAPALLELSTDKQRPPQQSFRGAVVRSVVPVELLQRVKELGEREETTLFMTLLAAFAVLLSRYSAQEDVVVASPVANRDRVELEGIIGFFVNTLALRIDLEGDPSFSALLARVRETAIGGFSNQELPFEKLVEEINPARHLSYPPLAQVLFVLQTALGEGSFQLHGLTQEPVRGARLTTKFDLSLYAIEGPEGLRVSIEYGTDLFEEATVSRMLDQYRLLLESAVSDPSRPIGELELVTPDEGTRLLAQFAGKEVFPVGCLHELFEQRAATSPDSVAVTFEGTSLSYDELNVRANKLAHLLRGAGVGDETLVALCLERSLDLVVAILAVLKAGGAYVPLDPDYPSDRLAFALEDTAATVLLTQERLIERLPDHGARVICLDRDADRIEEAPSTNPQSVTAPDSAAYVIYTSGSTGRPKGVTVEHRNVARLLTATERWFDFGADDCWLLLHSYAFDFSVWELWGALLYGGRLIVVPHGTTREPSLLRDLIVGERVTVLNATPSLFLAVMDELLSAADTLALRVVVFGGEALQPSALRPWFDRFGDGRPRLVNMYGITETTVHVTYRALSSGDGSRQVSPIGEPIPDLQVYVLDSRLKPVPEGVPGELFVGGAGVARGYLNRPELTAERFLANPHGDGMLYRSGDRARHKGGELFYLGRVDSQVKIRGFRIELGEIEATLRRQPGVRDALVAPREDESGDRRLFAYVAGDDPSPGVSELRDQLRLILPDYMVPSAFVLLDAFPLTPNGKVDRARLLAMNPSEEQREQTLTRPSTPLEEQLVAIWGSVLGVEAIGVHDDFFELGGHSLLAVRLFAEMQRKLGVRLPLSALFEAATIAGIAEIIERERREESEQSSIVRMRKGDREQPLFLVAFAGGEVLPYRDLVENLDPRLPVIGLRAPGADHRTTPLETVEGLAAHYVEEVRRVQPHGPYRLGGYCFSGLVAYEMARRLQAAGETIDSLALIDSYPFQTPRRRSTLETGRVQIRAFREADRAGRREWVQNRIAGLRGRLNRLIYITGGPRLFEALADRRLQRFLPHRPWNLVLIASNLARTRYVPQPLHVRLVFYRAQTEPHTRPTPWDALATDGVELRQIVAPEIDHETMMHEPHVQLLATRLMLDINASSLAETNDTRPPGSLTAVELSVGSK